MGEVEASNTGSLIILHTQEIAKERNQKRKGSTVENYMLDMKKSNSLKARFRSSAVSGTQQRSQHFYLSFPKRLNSPVTSISVEKIGPCPCTGLAQQACTRLRFALGGSLAGHGFFQPRNGALRRPSGCLNAGATTARATRNTTRHLELLGSGISVLRGQLIFLQ